MSVRSAGQDGPDRAEAEGNERYDNDFQNNSE